MSLNFIMQKYRILGKKGEGTFSEVLKCQNISDGTYFACKKMKQHYESLEQVNNLREIQAMRRLSPHANILELTEVLFDKKSGTLVLICELMDMNIYELIRGRRHYLPEQKIKNYLYQLCKSVEHMHRNGIFHRDVKPENILIKDDLLKLADFGSCRSVYSKQPYTEYISTRWYRAPECLLTDGFYTYKMDIWSVGCVMFEIMSLHPLFPGSNEVDQIAKIHDVMGTPDPGVLSKLRNKTRGMNFNFPQKKGSGIEKMLPHAPTESIDLIYQLCAYDPDDRISAKQALRHTYFRELRTEEKRHAALKAKREREKKEQERLQEEKAENKEDLTDVEHTDTQSVTKTETNNKENVELTEKQKRRRDREREKQKEKENNLKELSSKYKLDPIERLKEESEKEKKTRSPRPESGSSTLTNNTVRYPGSILHGRDPVYGYHKRERKRLNNSHPAYLTPFAPQVTLQRNYFERLQRKRNRLAESDANASGSTTFLPRVTQINKPSTFQPSFHANAYGQTTTLPKLGATSTTSTYLPSLTQAFAKPTKSKAAKNIYGSYHLPTIERRGEGY